MLDTDQIEQFLYSSSKVEFLQHRIVLTVLKLINYWLIIFQVTDLRKWKPGLPLNKQINETGSLRERIKEHESFKLIVLDVPGFVLIKLLKQRVDQFDV